MFFPSTRMNNEVQNEIHVWSVLWWMLWMFGVSASLMSQLGSCFIFHIAVYYQCFQFVFLCVTLEIESVGCRLLRKTRNRKEHRIHTGKGHCVTNVLCSFLCVILCAGFLSFQSVTKWMNNDVQNEVYVWSVFWWMLWIFGVDDSLMSQLGRVTPDTRCLQAEQFPNTSLMFFTRRQRAIIDKLLWSYNCESICSVHIHMLYWYIYTDTCTYADNKKLKNTRRNIFYVPCAKKKANRQRKLTHNAKQSSASKSWQQHKVQHQKQHKKHQDPQLDEQQHQRQQQQNIKKSKILQFVHIGMNRSNNT